MKEIKPELYGFIGKWGEEEEGHPLLYHLIDSAAVAELLWKKGLTSGARNQFCEWLHQSEDDCGRLLAFWASLHDLGKATPSFQSKHAPSKDNLTRLGFDFPPLAPNDIRHHSLLSQWILRDLNDLLEIQSVQLLNLMRFAIGGHHGTFHIQQDLAEDLARKHNLGGLRWHLSHIDLVCVLKELMMPPQLPVINLSQSERNALFNLLSGFFVTADWLASQDDLFQYYTVPMNPEQYQQISRQRAIDALTRTGWIGWTPDQNGFSFEELFSFSPRTMQEIVLQQLPDLADPFMLIIEAPTGCGKTEAALAVADHAIRRGNLRGLFIAMPTQATSNQMFIRTRNFLTRCYPRQKFINLQLAHGNAVMNREFQKIRVASVEDLEGTLHGSVSAMDWFMPRKRTMLSPFGVGTVDQVFMSVLRIRHAFLRLFGLHRKVVIFDEVHAYDVYMLQIFLRLLAWLRAIGTSVIILSATLPDQTRKEMLDAFQSDVAMESLNAAYPRLSINTKNLIRTINLGEYPDRKILLDHVGYEPSTWLEKLRNTLTDGGCAAIICNTVDRAQEVFSTLREAGLFELEDIHLLHARMPFCWRESRENAILSRFAKLDRNSDIPRHGVVVATQIIEQSLDLDFDLMISDLAPIDLLIQRIGRLHRHSDQAFPPCRPPKLSTPACWICLPDTPDEMHLPEFGADRWVYEPAILQRTYFSIAQMKELSLPSQSDALINQVYSEEPLQNCSPQQNILIRQSLQAMQNKHEEAKGKAENRMIGDADRDNAMCALPVYLREDDHSVGAETQALTRNNILPSVVLVCFYRNNGDTVLLDGDYPLNLEEKPGFEAVNHALRSQISISNRKVVAYFNAQPKNEAWKEIPALRFAYPVIFEEGLCKLSEELVLILDPQLGLVIKATLKD